MITFDEAINAANILISDNKYRDAIDQFEIAQQQAPFPEQKIDICNAKGRLYLAVNENDLAVKSFENSLEIHSSLEETKANKLAVNKATVLNNLGVLVLKKNAEQAVKYHKMALDIFEKENEISGGKYTAHLANTYYSYADASYQKQDFFNAKKQFKKAIETYEMVNDSEATDAFVANAYYNLGNVFTDEDNVYDARMNYMRALKLFRKLNEDQPEAYRSLVAATYNNLAVTAKTMYRYADAIAYYKSALEHYEILKNQDRETFLPFYASTLNNIGIIYSEQHEIKDDFDSHGLSSFSGFGALSAENTSDEKKAELTRRQMQKAIEYYQKAHEVYQELASNQPEIYTHYLATCLHNIGVLYDENSNFNEAQNYYRSALKIRRMLAEKQPADFNMDVCVTLLNVTTMYQILLEKELDISYKEKALDILKEIEERIAVYGDSEKPILLSMKGDVQYFTQFFNQVNEEYLNVIRTLNQVNQDTGKIDELIAPKEKLPLQQDVVRQLKELYDEFPNNLRVKSELLDSCIRFSWLALRSNELQLAEDSIVAGYQLDPNSLTLKANEAHLYLVRKQEEKAVEIYSFLKNLHDEANEKFIKILEADLKILKNDGVYFPVDDVIGRLNEMD